MLLQASLSDVMSEGREYSGIVFCSKCGEQVGPVTEGELKYLLYQSGDDCLCFGCEDYEPQKIREWTDQERSNLLRMFEKTEVRNLPTFSCNTWANRDLRVHMQLRGEFGWCLWFPFPDGRQGLRRVKMSLQKVEETRQMFDLVPLGRTGKPLVL